MSTAIEPKVRIQREDFSVTDEIEAIKKSSRNIGGITAFLGTGRELSKGKNIAELNFEHYPQMAEKKLEEKINTELSELRNEIAKKDDELERLWNILDELRKPRIKTGLYIGFQNWLSKWFGWIIFWGKKA